MATVKQGDTISINYTGKLEDGAVFDSSEGGKPLEFTVGEGELIPGLEQGVIGMACGETKVIKVAPEFGYGPREEERVFEFPKDKMGANIDFETGRQVQMFRADGMPVMATIIGKSETSYTMDCNHPLAGKMLIFETRLLEIK
ncbi:MAG TPA: peptidylprolyl isomerase [Nitrospiraceae bacterium]|nr:MAG: peptidylprolyl isomerase [Nitrospirae bacterium GWA2_46_11]OGW26128.1 MAG: peptidylprolyl isomerase [Nitrospirae bacterium GWB2_47_37]HAK89413.1 peptidylprolyl isomerase [Nitrospiraceae bacterium]HCZ11194.1 peptidylprolyl isomerase [Nitrospiraceae bacterium]